MLQLSELKFVRSSIKDNFELPNYSYKYLQPVDMISPGLYRELSEVPGAIEHDNTYYLPLVSLNLDHRAARYVKKYYFQIDKADVVYSKYLNIHLIEVIDNLLKDYHYPNALFWYKLWFYRILNHEIVSKFKHKISLIDTTEYFIDKIKNSYNYKFFEE